MPKAHRKESVAVLPLNQILVGDCVDLMRSLPSASMDVIFADPPYNLQLGQKLYRPNNSLVDGVDDAWDKFTDFAAYDQFTHSWLSEAYRLLKPNGTFWVIGSYHNIFRVGSILQDLGFWILNDIIWCKNNPMPNFRGKRFTNAHETLIWAAKSSASRPVFNYEVMKSLNDDKQMRSDWTMPICSGAERLRDEAGMKAHPTQKPEALLYRVILASSNVGDVVLDPFMGSGTTAAVAKKLGRNFIGLERDEDYARVAMRRAVEQEPVQLENLKVTQPKKNEIRIPFGVLLERGLLQPGCVLYNSNRKIKATVRADASLCAMMDGREVAGSIHKLGALLQGLPACNGWIFWYYENSENELVLLDTLRQEIWANKAEVIQDI